jgi:hypothetical protein
MFHLFTHAFFKAMLFLGAGSVIHAMHHEQDMRNYGGLRKKIPLTFWAMMIGTLAITGVGIPLTHYRLCRASCRRTRSSKAPMGRRRLCLLAAGDRGLLHQLLQLAADVPDLLRQAARTGIMIMARMTPWP